MLRPQQNLLVVGANVVSDDVLEREARLLDKRCREVNRSAIETTLALSQACERPDGGKYPCNDPSQLLDRILSYISIEADQTDAPPFTLDSDPKDVLRWMSTAVETIKLKVRQDVERAHRVPHLAEEECSRLRAMPPGHAAECYRAVATMSALARPY
tara:strand:- start:133 stop:603 length:471 start_codon:yes stop_codon:yes gene_type:complete